MTYDREVIRTISTARYRVDVFIMPEDTPPEDMVAWDDAEAEREYCERIRNGDLPWVTIGAEVSVRTASNWARPNVVGRAYLGCCDFLPFAGEYGTEMGRALIRDAIEDARCTAAATGGLRHA